MGDQARQADSSQKEQASIVANVAERIGALSDRTEGLHKLSLELQNRIRPPLVRAGQGVMVTEVDGFILGIPEDEWRLAAYYAFRGVPEPGPVALFKKLVRRGLTVVDVGANIGIYSLHAARIVGGEGRVHSFEPVPKIHQILRDNMQVNGFLETGTVEFHQMALGDWAGRSEFAVFPGNWGHSTLFPGDREADRIAVEVRSLDQMLGEGGRG
jgi:FkbM family methyltransferase